MAGEQPGGGRERVGQTVFRGFLPTPLGRMLTVASAAGLCGLEFDRPERATRLWKRLARWLPGCPVEDVRPGTPAGAVFDLTAAWLEAYFRSALDPGPDVPLQLLGTGFERQVWAALRAIAPGRSRSYGSIARELGRPDASRAVGAAVGANPVSLIVPCHRVVGRGGGLTGYGGGLDRKQWLLRHERTPEIPGELFLPPGPPGS